MRKITEETRRKMREKAKLLSAKIGRGNISSKTKPLDTHESTVLDVVVKSEPVDNECSKVTIESEPVDNECSIMTIKSEPVDNGYEVDANVSEIDIKSEIIDETNNDGDDGLR